MWDGYRGRTRIPLTLGVAFLLSFSCLSPVQDQALAGVASAEPPVVDRAIDRLTVAGNEILNANGDVVRLRGFNQSGTEYACVEGNGIFDMPDGTDVASVVAAMAGWEGANAVRVPLNEQCWLGLGVPKAMGGKAYRQAIVGYVRSLNEHGFVAVLDLHRSAPGKAVSLSQEQLPDRDHSPKFWRQVATVFRDFHSVVFDLFNEPYPYAEPDTWRAWKCWREGGCTLTSTNGGGKYTAAGMNELIAAIRGVGAHNIVLAGGIFWAEVLDRWLEYRPVDTANNLAASFHAYSFNTHCSSRSCYDKVLAAVATRVPLFIGEIGPDLTIADIDKGCPVSALGKTGFDSAVLDWADRHGASYTAWTWNPWPDCWALVSNWSGAATPLWGRLIRARLAAQPPD
ncbi:cellulase family glycosylhydrolase [Longispora sp. K20-0274]|uniref:glycoside hydrolase family 5 protein n=1 Tax=Longispora sp. K20-0274 TaxID=3088255 RepID=UPI0039994BB5